MTIHTRTGNARGVVALCFAALLAVLIPATAQATPLRIGEFFFDLPDGISPTVHLSNESTNSFTAFTISLVNDVEFSDGSTDTVTELVTSALAGGDSFQVLPFDFTPADAFQTTPVTARLSNLVFSVPGAITFSPDGGTSFEPSALLDLSLTDFSFGIYLEVPDVTDPAPVPEPGTLILLATGAAALRRRRIADAASFAAALARSTLKTHL